MIKRHDDISLKSLNTFGIDVKGACVVSFDKADDLPVIAGDTTLPHPIVPIGGGSNLLFTGDFTGTLLHNSMRHITPVSSPTAYGLQLVKVGGGVRLDYLCQWAAEHKLWGLENLSGIPGEVSGATIQNVGAYGMEFGDSVHVVKVFDLQEKCFITLPGVECEYGYRKSIFKEPELKGRIGVVEVTLARSREPKPRLEYKGLAEAFKPGIVPQPLQIREAVMKIRDSKLPRPEETGSAGSFFKNPVISREKFDSLKAEYPDIPSYDAPGDTVKLPAAWLIDRCGLKGFAVGGASVWHRQPLVIVNTDGHATSHDIMQVEQTIIGRVAERFGITLEPEVEHI